jgi:hypothetical protein
VIPSTSLHLPTRKERKATTAKSVFLSPARATPRPEFAFLHLKFRGQTPGLKGALPGQPTAQSLGPPPLPNRVPCRSRFSALELTGGSNWPEIFYRALAHPIARPNFVKRHVLADSGINLIHQRTIAVERFAVLDFHRSLPNARLQSDVSKALYTLVRLLA